MPDTEMRMRDMLVTGARYDPARADQIRHEVAERYDRRLLIWKITTWALLALDAVCMAGLAALFVLSESTKAQIACAAGFLFLYQSSLLQKGWYWYLSLRYRVQKDLVELKLQVAKLADGQSANEARQ